MPVVTSEILGFADPDGAADKVFVDPIANVPKTVTGDVAVTLEFVGDFGDKTAEDSGEWFSVSIDGYALGDKFQSFEYEAKTLTFSIAEADWAAIIADGKFDVTYTMGPGVDNITEYETNEFVRLTFSWETPVIHHPPSTPDPIKITGTDGDDRLPGTAGQDIIDGGAGNDILFAGGSDDTVYGGLGDDLIGGGSGNDELRGGEGNDTIFGGDGADAVYGGLGADLLFGGTGNDSIYGGDGDDRAWGGAGNDLMKGANGNDILGGGEGNDSLSGGAGNDILYGGNGNDALMGNMGNDMLFGGAGNDVLNGGLGNDRLFGGAGMDTFVFGANEGKDTILDFDAARDHIDLGGQTYTVSANADGFAVLELSGGGSVLLEGIAISAVDDGWFLAA